MNPLQNLPDPRRRSFRPRFCPNPECAFHRSPGPWRAQRDGFYQRRSDQARVQRFRCPHCRRRFSSQTFDVTYWLRYRRYYRQIAAMVCEGPGLRQAARLLGISYQTVLRHVARAGRHCLLFHQALRQGHPITEALVVDGFESFELSQYFPFHANLATGSDSWALYHFTDSPLRRKGTMTAQQKRRRQELEDRFGRPDPRAVERGMAALLRALLPAAAGPVLKLHSDDHPAYRRALRLLRREDLGYPRITHLVTSSKKRRTQANPLQSVNLADLLLRHGNANHRRETIAFSKRRQAAYERLATFTVWRNCIKKRREKARWPTETAAMRAGWTRKPWTWRQVFGRRLFPTKIDLPPEWQAFYWRLVKTAALGSRQTEHTCIYAF
jgi:hypothetical protein